MFQCKGLKSAVFVATLTTPVVRRVQLVRLHGKLSIKASEDLTLHIFSAKYDLGLEVMNKSIFTMYIA